MIGLLCIISNGEKIRIPEKLFKEDSGFSLHRQYENNCLFSIITMNKFTDDKVFYVDDKIIIIFDGVLFNDIEIKEKYDNKPLVEIFKQCIRENKLSELINCFRGSFYGFIYENEQRTIRCFTDQWSSKPLFYYSNSNFIIISSEVNSIVKVLKYNNYTYVLDKIGAYSLMSNGYMYKDYTLVKGLKRIQDGSIVTFKNKQFDCNKYHVWPKRTSNISYNDAVERLDVLFLKAVNMQIKKNARYGYRNIIPLSAGLDCRMVSFAAKKLGVTNVINYTYSESEQEDEKMSLKMAQYLGNVLVYKNLDNGLDLFDIDESIRISDGLIYYPWVSQLNGFLKLMDTKEWGIVHTGVIGDVILGCFTRDIKDVNRIYKFGDGSNSRMLINKLESVVTLDKCTYEEGMLKNRAINGACMGYSTSFRKYTESFSPFMDVDFAEFCFSLPYDYRIRHKIYYEWVKKKYPDATLFPHNGVKISTSKIYSLFGKKFRVDTLIDLIKKRIKENNNARFGMNPMDYWYNNNIMLKNRMDEYFEQKVKYIDDIEIANDVKNLYKNGNAIEKTMALSFLGSYFNLFVEM